MKILACILLHGWRNVWTLFLTCSIRFFQSTFFQIIRLIKRFRFLIQTANRWMRSLMCRLFLTKIEKKHVNWIWDWMSLKRINLTSKRKTTNPKTNKWPQMQKKNQRRVACLTVWYSFLNGQNFLPLLFRLVFFLCPAKGSRRSSFFRAGFYSILLGINNPWNIFYWYLCWFIS